MTSGGGAAKRRGEATTLNGDDLASYRKLAAREDPFGLATWRWRLAITSSDAVNSAIGPKQTSQVAPHMSAFGGKADIARARVYDC